MSYEHKDMIKIKSVDSTNNFAKELLVLQTKVPDFFCISTEYQTRGKGQKGNTWESEPSKNLLFSIIVSPNFLKPINQFYLSMAVSLGIKEYLETYVDNVTIKWPNDIYVASKKICGILIENTIADDELKHSIIGIGLNVNQKLFSEDLPNPTSLYNENPITYDLDVELKNVLSHISEYFERIKKFQYHDILTSYNDCLYLKDINSKFKDKHGIFRGIISKVEESGALIVKKCDDLTENVYLFKEIEFLI